ncbi:MAG TPA: S41 family peptidase [Candidatus Saccharimonadia bacterium]|nr:S41 family peptidase [Candidatus Saccharimonadia bacterium]
MSTGNAPFRTVRTIIFAALLLVLGGVVGFRFGHGDNVPLLSTLAQKLPYTSQITRVQNQQVPSDFSNVDFSQFWEVWRRLEANYYDPSKLDAKKMVYGAIQGMTAALGDPYTMYLPPDDQKRTQQDLQGSFDGVGIELGYRNNSLAVIAPIKGMAAEKAGIQAGDYILHIKDPAKNIDKDTTGISLPDAVTYIRGTKGTTVTLTMFREGGQPQEKTLTRDTIVVPSVELTYVDDNKNDGKKVAHLVLNKFGDNTQQEWNTAVQDIILQRNLRGIVLDLRNDPGGYLEEAIKIASEFIPSGVIVTQQGKDSSQTYNATGNGRLYDAQLVVLVNKGSASASEIVSGALRDRKHVKLVGENTFGKGTVQDAQDDLPNGAGLHITVAKWLLPSGTWIHEVGLAPDVQVIDDPATTDKDEALLKAIDTL